MEIYEVQDREAVLEALVEVWEASVRATHDFLSETEIRRIRGYVPQALRSVSHLVAAEREPGRPAAFMGTEGQRLEMLFLLPGERGAGLGRRLLTYGMERYGVQEVTVNLQNPQAVGFYAHMGFEPYRRTPRDEAGDPYPLLYMRRRQPVRGKAQYHLPGLFEFYDFYRAFLPLYREHREYFYDWCDIASLYGAPGECIWGGGRVGAGDCDPRDVLALTREYGISARLTFSNSLLQPEDLADRRCNRLCRLLAGSPGPQNGVIVHSDLLLEHLRSAYPELYLVSSTTKVLTDFSRLRRELERREFRYVVPDFRLNRAFDRLDTLPQALRDKVEFLCNECCDFGCRERRACYEAVSRENLGQAGPVHRCASPDAAGGYRFSRAMESPGFIGVEDIREIYLPMGFSQFKLEGRSLGSGLLLEFLLHYLTRPEYRIHVREALYLDNSLDLF